MVRSSCPPLPQELVDHTIDYLDVDEEDEGRDEFEYDDVVKERKKAKAALQSCTLVSRSWSARSYALYQRTVHLNQRSLSPISTFRALLSSSSRLRAAIHILWIRGTGRAVSHIDPEWLVTLFDCLENLYSITMHRVVCNTQGMGIQQWNRSAPLRYLGLYAVETTTSEEFALTAAFFAKVPVQKLAIATFAGDIKEPEQGPLYSEHAALFSEWQVGEVELGKEAAGGLLDILSATKVQYLRSLTLPKIYMPAMALRFIRLAESLGPHVTSLRVEITPPFDEHFPLILIAASAAVYFFRSLEILELDWYLGDGTELRGPLPKCNHLEFIKYVSRSIRHVVFRFYKDEPSRWILSATPSAIYELESRLLALPNLQSLTIMASRWYGRPPLLFARDAPVPEDEVKKMQETLPRLFQAGKLRFSSEMGHHKLTLVAV